VCDCKVFSVFRRRALAVIILKNVWKRYGALDIVKGFNIEISDKSFYILLGPSCCRKTTTLCMIAGLE
jgi:ABC-type sugar transport system ATPase subunit